MKQFVLQTYTKKELALLYFPDSEPNTAVNHLMRWIRRSPTLYQQLQALGYRPTNKFFTPRQVAAIITHLGEP